MKPGRDIFVSIQGNVDVVLGVSSGRSCLLSILIWVEFT